MTWGISLPLIVQIYPLSIADKGTFLCTHKKICAVDKSQLGCTTLGKAS